MNSRQRNLTSAAPGGGGPARSMIYNRNSSFNNRGGGGAHFPKPYHHHRNQNQNQPPPPPRTTETILIEAGRLATEYLVSQGILPPNVLTDSRTSVLNRLGAQNQSQNSQNGGQFSSNFDLGLGFSGNRNSSSNRMRGNGRRNRFGGFRSNAAGDSGSVTANEWGSNRDYRRNTGFNENEEELGFGGQIRREEDKAVVGANAEEEVAVKMDEDRDFRRNTGFTDYEEELALGFGGLNRCEEVVPTQEVEVKMEEEESINANVDANDNDEMKVVSSGEIISEVKEEMSSDGLEKEQSGGGGSHSEESDVVSKNGNDLLRLCNFAKVPTRTRSALIVRNPKIENVIMAKEDMVCDVSPTEGSKQEDPSVDTLEDVEVLGSVLAVELAVEKDDCAVYEQESGLVLSELGRSNSVVKDRGDKRALEDEDMREGSKKPRECTDDDFFHLHSFNPNPTYSQKSTTPDVEVVEVVDHDSFFNVSLLPRGESESGIEFTEEKQLFPSSFKICDLNLMESIDITHSHGSGPVYGLPSNVEANQGAQVDVDLTISHSCNRADEYEGSATDAKETIIVEVDDDSGKEDDDFDTSEGKTSIAHSSLESFPNHIDTTGDHPDGQDGYGSMISELLGNDISNCSSVPGDITNMHTEMGLHHGAEILDDDDPIYLSLGEIPISFLGVWEQQPNQPFEKPF